MQYDNARRLPVGTAGDQAGAPRARKTNLAGRSTTGEKINVVPTRARIVATDIPGGANPKQTARMRRKAMRSRRIGSVLRWRRFEPIYTPMVPLLQHSF